MLTSDEVAYLTRGVEEWGLTLSPETALKFGLFAQLLVEVGRELNLTRIPREEIVKLHFLDSLALAAIHKPSQGAHLLDVGTGAGFPGLPLALAFPELDVTLLDGTRKRLAFLDTVISELGLTNVRTLQGRAEELAHTPAGRESFDIVTARAVAKMPVLAGWLIPLVKPGGIAVAYKSQSSDGEVAEAVPLIQKLRAKIEQTAEITLPDTEIRRHLVVMRKLLTPGNAPRRPAHAPTSPTPDARIRTTIPSRPHNKKEHKP